MAAVFSPRPARHRICPWPWLLHHSSFHFDITISTTAAEYSATTHPDSSLHHSPTRPSSEPTKSSTHRPSSRRPTSPAPTRSSSTPTSTGSRQPTSTSTSSASKPKRRECLAQPVPCPWMAVPPTLHVCFRVIRIRHLASHLHARLRHNILLTTTSESIQRRLSGCETTRR